MATYQVGADGKAPKGLQVDDLVVTKNGTYIIRGVNSDGTYNSEVYNAGQSVSNYQGSYQTVSSPTSTSSGTSKITDAQKYAQSNSPAMPKQSTTTTSTAAGYGSTVTNPGEGTLTMGQDGTITRTMANGRSFYVNPNDEKYNSIYAEYMSNQQSNPVTATAQVPEYQAPDTSALEAQVQELTDRLANQTYTPPDQATYRDDILTNEEALTLANQLVAGKYDDLYKQTATNAAQNLERSGLYDSLYGQALAMSQENSVTNAKQQAVSDLAMQLVGQSRDEALSWYQQAVNESQFGANYQQNALSQAANMALNTINTIVNQAKYANDYALEKASLDIQAKAQALEMQYKNGVLNQMQLENELIKLETEAQRTANAAAAAKLTGGSGRSSGSSSGGSSGSGSIIDLNLPSGDGQGSDGGTVPSEEDKPAYSAQQQNGIFKNIHAEISSVSRADDLRKWAEAVANYENSGLLTPAQASLLRGTIASMANKLAPKQTYTNNNPIITGREQYKQM